MALTVPNIAQISKESPKVGEALQKEITYINTNVTPAASNTLPPPGSTNIQVTAAAYQGHGVDVASKSFVNPTRPGG
jgi:hypothetical protein